MRITSIDLWKKLGIKDTMGVMEVTGLRWLGHVGEHDEWKVWCLGLWFCVIKHREKTVDDLIGPWARVRSLQFVFISIKQYQTLHACVCVWRGLVGERLKKWNVIPVQVYKCYLQRKGKEKLFLQFSHILKLIFNSSEFYPMIFDGVNCEAHNQFSHLLFSNRICQRWWSWVDWWKTG